VNSGPPTCRRPGTGSREASGHPVRDCRRPRSLNWIGPAWDGWKPDNGAPSSNERFEPCLPFVCASPACRRCGERGQDPRASFGRSVTGWPGRQKGNPTPVLL